MTRGTVPLVQLIPEFGAACQEYPWEMFYPEQGQNPLTAKGICDGCELRAACLRRAMAYESGECKTHRFGVWGGGLTPNERSRLDKAGWRPGDPIPAVKIPKKAA